MFYKSIRFKITIVYMAILASTLLIFSTILYHQVSKSLYDNIDTLLSSRAEGIVSAISTYWTTEKLGAMRYGAATHGEAADVEAGHLGDPAGVELRAPGDIRLGEIPGNSGDQEQQQIQRPQETGETEQPFQDGADRRRPGEDRRITDGIRRAPFTAGVARVG